MINLKCFYSLFLVSMWEVCWELGQSFPKDSLIQWQFFLHLWLPPLDIKVQIEMILWRKCRKRLILGETISIIYFSLDHLLFQNIVQACTYMCQILKKSWEAYLKAPIKWKILSVTVVTGGTLHTLKSCIPYFYSSVTKNMVEISSQKEGCQTFNGDVNVYLKEHLNYARTLVISFT